MYQDLKYQLARAALVLASFVSSSLLMLAVSAAFHHASRQPWLRDTPQARLAAERCRALAGRTAQHDCMAAAALQAQARDAGAAQLAALQLQHASIGGAAR